MSVVPDSIGSFGERSWTDSLRIYVDITRPKVMALVVFTGLPALLLGQFARPVTVMDTRSRHHEEAMRPDDGAPLESLPEMGAPLTDSRRD